MKKHKLDIDLLAGYFWIGVMILMIVAIIAYAILCAWAFFTYADTPITELPAWVWWIMQTSGR